MGTARKFTTGLSSQISKTLNRMTPENPQLDCFLNQNYVGKNLIAQVPSGPTVPPINRMPPVTLQPHTLISPDDPRMYWMPQVQHNPTIRKKHQGRTSFTHKQHKELEALFSQTSFPDKNLQKDLAARLNLQEKTIKVWFRNRRFKQRKQQKQQQQSLQQSSQILPAKKNMPSSLRMSTNPYSFFPTVLNLHSSPPYQPMSPSDCSEDFVFTESPEIDFQVQDPQLERLMASVPALFPNTYDIIQIIELYSFPGECEVSSCSFSCLCQYLSHARSQLEGQTVSLSTFHGPAVGPPPGQTCTPSIMSQGSAPCSLRDSPAFQSLPTR